MNTLLRFSILIIPIVGILFFYNLLTEDKFYPGANFKNFNVPNFELEALNSDSFYTKEDLGNELLLNVWASWCITCRIEHGFLMKLNSEGVRVTGLNYKDESIDAINWLNSFGNPYNFNLHDLKGSLALDMGVTGAPETFLIKDGVVLVHYSGEVNQAIWDKVFIPIIKENKMFK
tara:strand:+ start:6188 stop:6712 length:525 start_codon:yes stop_codon:yes gene_type:complete